MSFARVGNNCLEKKIESDYTLNLGASKYAFLFAFLIEMFTIVDFVLHVKSKQWTTLLGIHNYIKMFEKLRVYVCECGGSLSE